MFRQCDQQRLRSALRCDSWFQEILVSGNLGLGGIVYSGCGSQAKNMDITRVKEGSRALVENVLNRKKRDIL